MQIDPDPETGLEFGNMHFNWCPRHGVTEAVHTLHFEEHCTEKIVLVLFIKGTPRLLHMSPLTNA